MSRTEVSEQSRLGKGIFSWDSPRMGEVLGTDLLGIGNYILRGVLGLLISATLVISPYSLGYNPHNFGYISTYIWDCTSKELHSDSHFNASSCHLYTCCLRISNQRLASKTTIKDYVYIIYVYIYTLSKWTLRNFWNNYWENTWLKTSEAWLSHWWGDHSAVYSSQQLELPSGLKTCLGVLPGPWGCKRLLVPRSSPSWCISNLGLWIVYGIPSGKLT